MTETELKSKLNTSLEHFKGEIASIRTGRATTSLVEEIKVDVYGTKMTIKELGSITTPDTSLILISPWDKSVLKDIDKAIREAGLSLNPVTDSTTVKVPIPPLTEERRKEFVRLVSERAEEAKVSMRNVRQEAMKAVDNKFEEKLVTEDEKFTQKDAFEKIVKDFVLKIDTASEEKKEELMRV